VPSSSVDAFPPATGTSPGPWSAVPSSPVDETALTAGVSLADEVDATALGFEEPPAKAMVPPNTTPPTTSTARPLTSFRTISFICSSYRSPTIPFGIGSVVTTLEAHR
jgi:hypothetical protein